jgi:hypothetical protein
MTLLPTEALGFNHGDSGNANFVQRLLHFVQFEGLDDRFDLFHWSMTPVSQQSGTFIGQAGISQENPGVNSSRIMPRRWNRGLEYPRPAGKGGFATIESRKRPLGKDYAR